jgi:hypothetical protein
MKVAVVTSSPPLAEGGHLVIARSVVDALREAGHAGLVVTPQNRFGRQASAISPTGSPTSAWPHDGSTIDHVISFRYRATPCGTRATSSG